jgi:hypothetical protein
MSASNSYFDARVFMDTDEPPNPSESDSGMTGVYDTHDQVTVGTVTAPTNRKSSLLQSLVFEAAVHDLISVAESNPEYAPFSRQLLVAIRHWQLSTVGEAQVIAPQPLVHSNLPSNTDPSHSLPTPILPAPPPVLDDALEVLRRFCDEGHKWLNKLTTIPSLPPESLEVIKITGSFLHPDLFPSHSLQSLRELLHHVKLQDPRSVPVLMTTLTKYSGYTLDKLSMATNGLLTWLCFDENRYFCAQDLITEASTSTIASNSASIHHILYRKVDPDTGKQEYWPNICGKEQCQGCLDFQWRSLQKVVECIMTSILPGKKPWVCLAWYVPLTMSSSSSLLTSELSPSDPPAHYQSKDSLPRHCKDKHGLKPKV